MTTLELARIVKDMRDAQRSYFAARTPATLEISRQKERALDKVVREIIEDRPALLPGLDNPTTNP